MKTAVKLISILACLLVSLIGLYYFHKSPNYQFFGTLISNKDTTKKVVALTFDDGPSNLDTTLKVLDILDDFGIKATFFLVGEAMEKNPEAVEEIVRRGHELANHSYTHKMMLLKSQRWLAEEITKTDSLIRRTGHTGEIYFRPPFGKKLLTLPWYLSSTDRRTITWDIDADSRSMDAKEIRQIVKEQLKPGSIILMHVLLSSRKGSRAALPGIIEDLQDEGFRFLTLSELFGSKDQNF